MILFLIEIESEEGWHDWQWSDKFMPVMTLQAATIVKAFLKSLYPEYKIKVTAIKPVLFVESKIKQIKLQNVDAYSDLNLAVFPINTEEAFIRLK